MHQILNPKIYQLAERHGATIDSVRHIPVYLQGSSAMVKEYHSQFQWLKIDFQSDVSEEMYGPIQLNGTVEPLPKDYVLSNADGMNLYAIGQAGGENFVLLVDANDTNPANPSIYQMDYDLEIDDSLRKICSMEELFESLKG